VSNLINNKIITIAIYGSCISKDPFTTIFNKNYKEYFDAIINDQRHSFISTMQEKKDIPDEDIIIQPLEGNNKFETKCIKEDLEKKFITDITENNPDYLIFDVHFEIENGVLQYNNNEYISNFARLHKTRLYNKLSNKKAITMQDDTQEFFNLWKLYCDKFFTFMKEKSPETKIILAEVRALDKVEKDDSTYYIDKEFSQKVEENNPYYKQLEDYIKDNYDVYVVDFDSDAVLKENHRWGKHFLHYNDEYYAKFLNKVITIVEYDQLKKNEIILKNEIQELNDELNLTDNELTKKIKQSNDELKTRNNQLINKIKTLNNELKRTNNELNNINIEIKRTNNDLKKLYEENNQLKQKNLKLESKLKKENSALSNKVKQLFKQK